jgi:flavin-binding protein dodecin
MSVARVTEITATSPKSFEEAIQLGIARANKTLQNVKGAWIKDLKVEIDNGKISAYRIVMKVTFVLND